MAQAASGETGKGPLKNINPEILFSYHSCGYIETFYTRLDRGGS